MSTTIAAIIATLITTGMTSAVSHTATLIGGSLASLMLAGCTVLSRNARVYPVFLVGTIALSVLVLVSSEVNTSEFSSTIHVLSSYAALAALAFSSSDVSSFCRQLMLGTNLLLTYWILYQAYHLSTLQAWLISNPAGAGNLMAAQINMTLPLVLSRVSDSVGPRKALYIALVPLNCLSVLLVMSRNGIGTLAIILTLYVLFNHKRLAVFCLTGIVSVSYFFDNILNSPIVHQLLVRMRLVGFVAAAPRSLIWRISWDRVAQKPWLGVGPGNPQKFLAVLDINHAHNNFMQVALEAGLPAAAAFASMMLLLMWLPASAIVRQRACFVHTLPLLAYVSFSWTGGPLAFPGATLLLAACVNEARTAIKRDRVNAEARDIPSIPVKIPVRQTQAA